MHTNILKVIESNSHFSMNQPVNKTNVKMHGKWWPNYEDNDFCFWGYFNYHHFYDDETFTWAFVGLDSHNTRNNTDESILRVQNVSSLNNIGLDGHIDTTVGANDEVEWIGGVGAAVLVPPVVDDGVVYFADLAGLSYAYTVDGTLLWQNQLPITVGTSFTSFSLLTEDKIFYLVIGDPFTVEASELLIASDRNTGEITGSWDATEYHPNVALSGAPMTVHTSFDGGLSCEELIVFGLSSFENGFLVNSESELGPDGFTFPGGLIAFKTSDFESEVHIEDAAWVFTTTDNHYNIPLAADQEISSGSTIWSVPVSDRGRGVLYVGTGQNYDEFDGLDEFGKEPVDNPLSDAIIAVDYTTGQLSWSYQVYQNDFWSSLNEAPEPGEARDWDISSNPITFTIDGRDYLSIADKVGGLYILDLSAIDEADEDGVIDLDAGPVRLDTLFSMDQDVNDAALKSLGILVWQKDYPGGEVGPLRNAEGDDPEGSTALAYDNGILYMSKHDVEDFGLTERNYFYSIDVKGIVRGLYDAQENEPTFNLDETPNVTDEYFWDDVKIFEGQAGLISIAGDVVYLTTSHTVGVTHFDPTKLSGMLRGYDKTTGELLFEHIGGEVDLGGGFIVQTAIYGGATIADGQIFIGTGDLFSGQGGLKVLSLPEEGTNKSDTISGRPLNNLVDGGNGDDTIFGGPGDDVLRGGNGKDLLSGDAGNDTLTGGNGKDIFVFNLQGSIMEGHDIITDFVEGTDKMQFSGAANMAALNAAAPGPLLATVDGIGALNDTVFTFVNGGSITLLNVNLTGGFSAVNTVIV